MTGETVVEQDILEYVNRSLDEEEDFHFLRFEQLQRLNIVHQQLRLTEIKERIKKDSNISTEELDSLKGKLEDYGTV